MDGITAANSNNIAGTTTLDAGGSIAFATAASTFNALDAQADDRISVNVNVTTDTGNLALDGDADNAADTNDDIQLRLRRDPDLRRASDFGCHHRGHDGRRSVDAGCEQRRDAPTTR